MATVKPESIALGEQIKRQRIARADANCPTGIHSWRQP